MRISKCLFAFLMSLCLANVGAAYAGDAVTKIRGKSVKLFEDQKGRTKINTIKTKDIVLPAEILSERSNAPYLKVRINFVSAGRPSIDAWIKRFKVKTNIPANLVIHCSANDNPNESRVAGVRAVGNEQCK